MILLREINDRLYEASETIGIFPERLVIAGGFIVDTLLGFPYKDVDVFIRKTKKDEVAFKDKWRYIKNYGSVNAFAVIDGLKEFQFVFHKERNILKTFDLNCCEASYDLKEGLKLNKRFQDFLITNTLNTNAPACPFNLARALKKHKKYNAIFDDSFLCFEHEAFEYQSYFDEIANYESQAFCFRSCGEEFPSIKKALATNGGAKFSIKFNRMALGQ